MRGIVKKCYIAFLIIIDFFSPAEFLNCFTKNYPLLFGDSFGDTEYTSIDRDINGNIAIGGQTMSTVLNTGGSGPNPLLVLINPNGDVKWHTSFNTALNFISSVAFNPTGTELAFTTYSATQNYLVFVDPTQVSYIERASFKIQRSNGDDLVKTGPNSLLYDGSDVYIGMQAHIMDSGSHGYRFKIVRIDKNGVLKWEYTLNRGLNGRAYEIIEGLNSDLYVGGWEDKKQNGHFYIVTARILKNQATSQGTEVWYHGSHQGTQTEPYYISKLGLSTSTQTKLVGCLSQESTTESSFGIAEIVLDPATYSPTITSALYENLIVNEVQECQGLYIRNSETFYAYVSLKISKVQRLATITSSTKGVQYQNLPINLGTMGHSVFIDEQYSYYVGSLSSISQVSPTQSYVNKIGYIMSFRIQQSCYTYTYTSSTPVTMTILAYTFDTTTSLKGPIDNMNTISNSLTPIKQGSNTINSNFCTATVTISVPAYSDQTYYIADPSEIYSVPQFSLSQSCDDAVWTYSHQYLNPTSSPFPSFITQSGFSYTVQTNDQTKVGTYQMRITGTLQNGQSAQRTFNINIVLDCARLIITKGSITATQNYDITTGSALILGSTSGWSQNIGSPGCSQIIFSLNNQLGGTSADPIFYFSGTNIMINTQDYLKVGVYNLNLVGTSGTVSSTLPFTVNVQNQCGALTISTTAINSVTYFTTQAIYSVTITPFTTGSTICNNLISYDIKNSDNTNIDTTVFTFDQPNLILQVQTSDTSKIKLYGLKVIAYLINPTNKVEVSFNVDVRNNCENLLISKSGDISQIYTVKDPSIILNSFTFTSSLSGCGTFTYTLLNQDNSIYDSSIFTFNSASPSISIQTTNISKVGLYNLKITGSVGSWKSALILITVTIKLGCIDSVLTTSPITTQTYFITETTKTVQFTDWTSSVTLCGAISYQAQLSNGSPLDSTLVTFDSNTRTFTITSSNPIHIASYVLKVSGSIAAGPSAQITFNLDVLNPCNSLDIGTPSVPDQTYYIFGTNMNFVLPVFTNTGAHASCSGFQYKLENGDSTVLDGSIFSFNGATRTLTGSSTDPLKISTYTLKYTGYLFQTSVSKSVTFKVNVLHICSTVIITPPTITPSPVVYTCRDAKKDLTNLAFSANINLCGSFTYTLVNSDYTALDTTVFTFDQNTPALSIQTNNPTKVKTYQLLLTATLQHWGSQSLLIDIIIQYGCLDTVITTYTVTPQTYFISDTPLTFSIQEWESSVTGCTPFIYNPTINSLALDSNFINFNSASKTFTINTSDPQYIKTYTIDFKGTLTSGGVMNTVQIILDIRNPCENSIIVPPPVGNYLYYVLNTALTDILPVFSQDLTNPVCSGFTYVLLNLDGTALDTSIINFNAANRQISVQSNNSLKIKVYQLKYEAYLLQTSKSASVTFQLEVKHLCSTVVITPPVDQTIGYVVKEGIKVINGLIFSENINQCGSFSYSLTDGNNNQYDISIFTFDSTTPKIQIFTNLPTQVGTYVLKLKATLGVWGSSTTIITVQISLGCTDTLITPSIIATQQYALSDTTKIIAFSEWTSSVTGCTPFTYTASINGQALNLPYITLDQTNKQFSVQSSDSLYLGSFTVTLVGTLSSGAQKSMIFQLDITNPCVGATINPPTITNYDYYIFGTDLNVILPVFTQNLATPICQTFTYEVKNIDDSTLDPIFTFNPTTRALKATTTDINKIKTYYIKYRAYILQPSVSNSINFEVRIKHLCETVSILVPPDQILNYREKNPSQDIISLAFTDPLSICGAFIYSLSNFDGSTYDSQIFTFVASTPKIVVHTNMVSKVGTHVLKLTGQLGSFAQAFIKITVNIELGCADTTITPTLVPTYTYDLTNPIEKFSFSDWSSSVTLCGSFTYSATYIDGSSLDGSVLQFNAGLREFSVQTFDITKVNSYIIKVRGTLVDGASTFTTFILKIQNPCANVIFTIPTITKITYYLLGPDLNTVLPTFSHNSVHPACADITYSLSNSDGSPTDNNIFTFNPTDRSLLAKQTNLSYIKTYNLKYKAQILSQTMTSNVDFQLEVKHVCNIVVITKAADRTEDYAVDDPPKLINSLQFSDDLALCGNFVYSLTYSDGSVVDASIFTFDPLVPSISVSSHSAAHIKTYFLKLKGTLSTWGFKETLITVNIVNGCTLTTITTKPIPYFQIYKVTQSPLTITFDEWESSVIGCGSFTYVAQKSDGSTLPTCIAFNPLTKTFSIQTSNISDKGTFIINVIGSLVDGATKTLTFKLDIVNPCQLSIITPSSPLNQVFTIPQASIDYVVPNFTQDLSDPICTQFQYILENKDGTSIDPSIFTFNSLTQTLTISITDESKLGIYQLKLIGFLLELPKQNFALFQVEIKHVCQAVIITPPLTQQVIYYDKSPALTITSLTFSENINQCGLFTYQLFNLDGSSYSTSVFTFDSTTPVITVATSSASKAGLYNLKILATLGRWGQSEIQVQITIYKSCTEATLYPYLLPNQIYGITAPAKAFSFYEWSADVPGCGSFTYTVTDNLNNALDPLKIQYNSISKTFIVENHDFVNIGEIWIKIVGQLGTYTSMEYQFKVSLACLVTNIIPVIQIEDQRYKLDGSRMEISVPSLVQTPSCGFPLSENVRLVISAGNYEQLPEFITYDQADQKFLVQTKDEEYSSLIPYVIQMNLWTFDLEGKKQFSYRWNLFMQKELIVEAESTNEAPQFENELVTRFEMIAGEFELYNIPKPIETNQNKVSMRIECQQINNFGICSNQQIILQPKDIDVGTYYIQIQLKDNHHKSPLMSNFQIIVVVMPNLDTSQNSIFSKPQYATREERVFAPMPVDNGLKVKVKQAQENGILILEFNKDIQMPKKDQIDTSVLDLRILDSSQLQQLGFTWECISTTSNEIYIQLHFDDPTMISSAQDVIIFFNFQILSKIQIQFLKNELFYVKHEQVNRTLSKDFILYKVIPPQVIAERILIQQHEYRCNFNRGVYSDIQYSTKCSSNEWLSFLCFVKQMIKKYRFNIQYTWYMLYSIQLLSHIPLLSINLPPNAMYFYAMMKNGTLIDYISYRLESKFIDTDTQKYFSDKILVLDIFQFILILFEDLTKNDIVMK